MLAAWERSPVNQVTTFHGQRLYPHCTENAYSGGQFRTRSCKMRLKQNKHGKLQRRMKKRRSEETSKGTGNGKRDHRQPARLGDNCSLMIRHKLSSLRPMLNICLKWVQGATPRSRRQVGGSTGARITVTEREREQRNNHWNRKRKCKAAAPNCTKLWRGRRYR